MQIPDNPPAFQTALSKILTFALLYQDCRRDCYKKTASEEKLEVERDEEPECKSFLSTLRANCFSGKNVERSTLRSNWKVLQGRNLLRGKMGSPARNINSTIRL